jgi:hydroxymethylglutaryl-CoA lyase
VDIEIVEVGPRDGLQNESAVLTTEDKVELIGMLAAAGLRRIEIASFVNPRLVPQMADGDAVVAALPDPAGFSRIGLALNRRGFTRALEAGVDEINFSVMSTDAFNQKNQGASTFETLAAFEEVVVGAAGKVPVTLTIGASFGCPYEGETPAWRVIEIAERAAAAGASELALGDTIGVADPKAVTRMVSAVRGVIGDVPIRCHFHNTRNTGLANAYAAVEAGVRVLDSSIGGIGGCPFAPDATGNIPTEDLAYMLGRMGTETGLDLEHLIEIPPWLAKRLGKQVPGLLSRAGLFPSGRSS